MAFKTKEALLSRLESVFPEAPYQGTMPVCPCNCDECQELSEQLLSKPWFEHESHELAALSSGNTLFTSQAFDYLLPAFIRADLLSWFPASAGIEAWHDAYFASSDRNKPHRNPEGLTFEQRSVLYDWIECRLLADVNIPNSDLEIARELGLMPIEMLPDYEKRGAYAMWLHLAELREQYPFEPQS